MVSTDFYYFIFFYYSVLFFVFFFNFFSFFNCLLILESISLLIYVISLASLVEFSSLKFSLYFLVFVVCESSIGLSILVKSVKFFGVNNFRSMNLLMF